VIKPFLNLKETFINFYHNSIPSYVHNVAGKEGRI